MSYLTALESAQLTEYADNYVVTDEDGNVYQLEAMSRSDFPQFVQGLFGADRLAQLSPDAYDVWADDI